MMKNILPVKLYTHIHTYTSYTPIEFSNYEKTFKIIHSEIIYFKVSIKHTDKEDIRIYIIKPLVDLLICCVVGIDFIYLSIKI